MHLLPLLTCLFFVSSVLAQTASPLPNVGIEISPSSVIAQPISTLSLRATAYSSLPNCDILSYTWSTIKTPVPIPETSSQPIFTTPNDRITSVTGLTEVGTYNFQLAVQDCNATLSLPFTAIVANSSLESDFFVLPPTLITTPGFVFPPTLPPTLPPTTSAPTIPADPTTPPVDPSLPGPTDPNTGLPVGGGGGGGQQPNPPVINAGQGKVNTTPSSNSFNIMYVIIPAAVVAGLLFIAICVYCRRKNQIPANRTQSSSTSSISVGNKISQPFEAFTGANQLTSPV